MCKLFVLFSTLYWYLSQALVLLLLLALCPEDVSPNIQFTKGRRQYPDFTGSIHLTKYNLWSVCIHSKISWWNGKTCEMEHYRRKEYALKSLPSIPLLFFLAAFTAFFNSTSQPSPKVRNLLHVVLPQHISNHLAYVLLNWGDWWK